MKSLDQIDVRDKTKLLKLVKEQGSRVAQLLNENQENIMHLIASEKSLKNSQSISGNKDMTFYEIIEALLHQNKGLAYKTERTLGQNPLHYAFKTGNLECALWMVQIVKKEYGSDAQLELINSKDNDGMRPIDLLAFMIDDYHKSFIRTFHNTEKNYKLAKRFEAYSWGYSDEFQLGYAQLNNSRKHPKKINFPNQENLQKAIHNKQQLNKNEESPQELDTQQQINEKNSNNFLQHTSIKDVKVANNFTLALTEDGQVYSWGSGINGHLGHGDENSRLVPEVIKLDLKDEEKRIRKLKRKHRDMEEVEELMTLHSFVKSATKGGVNLSQSQAFIEQECLLSLHNIDGGQEQLGSYFLGERNNFDLKSGKGKKSGKNAKNNKFLGGIQQQQQQSLITKREIDVQLLLLKIDNVQVSKIVCSNKHSLICTNTGSVFSWGENDAGQLGYSSRKESSVGFQNMAIDFQPTPRKIEQLSKMFAVNVACGDYHSGIITNQSEVYMWGSNKNGQLGIDMENCLQSNKPQKVQLYEYMNSSMKERFINLKAKYNYTVLVCESKNIYVSDKNQNQFVALFAKSGNSNAHKKLESQVFLGNDYILAMDMSKSIYFYKIFSQAQNKHQQDVCVKRIANEIYQNSNFIELHPTDHDIWAVNSLRQLLVCKDFKSKMSHNSQNLDFEPVNQVFNVMKAAIGQKHQVVIKIIKQLDEMMIRDVYTKRQVENSFEETEENFEIPMPSSCLLDMGISVSGGFTTPNPFSIEDPTLKEEEFDDLQYIPSLADICINHMSNQITLDNALDTYELADHLIIDELKINCLKFISLNIVSYLESTYIDKLVCLPVYLLRDLENFIKLEDDEKYVYQDMQTIEEAEFNQNEEIKKDTGMKQQKLSEDYCAREYQDLSNMLSEYEYNSRLQDQLRTDLCSRSQKFRQQLRKAFKKFRKGSSNLKKQDYIVDDQYDESPIQLESIIGYLDLINDFIKSNIQQEMNDFQQLTQGQQNNSNEKNQKNLKDGIQGNQTSPLEEEKEYLFEKINENQSFSVENTNLFQTPQSRDQEEIIENSRSNNKTSNTVIIKKKKGNNRRQAQANNQNNQSGTQEIKDPVKTQAPIKKKDSSENLENFFIKVVDDKQAQLAEFEKQSLDNDFMIVKQSDKKINKIVNKSKQQQIQNQNGQNKQQNTLSQQQQEEKFMLSDLLGLQVKSQELKRKSTNEDYLKSNQQDIWNYLGQNNNNTENNNSQNNSTNFIQQNNECQRTRFTSFEDIQREELERKTRTISGGLRKNSSLSSQNLNTQPITNSSQTNQQQQPLLQQNQQQFLQQQTQKTKVRAVIKNEQDTKNDWGLIKEQDEIDFDEVMVQEKIRKEEQKKQSERDEELAKIMIEEELRRQDEEILQKVLRESMMELSLQQEREEQPNLQGSYSTSYHKKGPNKKGKKVVKEQKQLGNQSVQQKWVPKQK